jgi:hypothetical protein
MLEHPPYSPDMSPCSYDLFAEMKESMRGTRYNKRKIIHAVGLSLLDIDRRGRADGVQCLTQIWQKMVHMGAIILKGCKCVFTVGNSYYLLLNCSWVLARWQ